MLAAALASHPRHGFNCGGIVLGQTLQEAAIGACLLRTLGQALEDPRQTSHWSRVNYIRTPTFPEQPRR